MLTHDLGLNTVLTNPKTARRTRRISPVTNEITSQIISRPPAPAAPLIAPDFPVAIHPGPVLGVARDDLTDTTVADASPPVEVDDRAVADPAITPLDLVRALHRTPRHAVLVFSGHRVALFERAGGQLTPAAGTSFPMDLPALDGPGHHGVSLRSALAAVDLALSSYLRTHQAPVVLAGPQKLVSAFCSASQNVTRFAGTVYGGFGDAPTTELARRARPALDRYLESHQFAALALLQDRVGDQQMASGITSVWRAAHTRQPELLLVEDGYRFRARLSAADALTPADDVTPGDDDAASEVIGNLVDELIETVLARGGSIVLAHEGALDEHDRVALTLR
jgi:hypothetical protein